MRYDDNELAFLLWNLLKDLLLQEHEVRDRE
jgi:hypothetical protein